MIARTFLLLLATLCGIGFGQALAFAVVLAQAETLMVDGTPQWVIRYQGNTPETREGLGEFPTDFVPHRVLRKTDPGRLLMECQAVELAWRVGVIYSVGGGVLGLAFVFGGKPSKALAAGLLTAAMFSAFLFPFRQVGNDPAVVLMIVSFALMAACGEAIHSAYSGRRRRPAHLPDR